MPLDIAVTKATLDNLKKIQEYMLLAKKDNAGHINSQAEKGAWVLI